MAPSQTLATGADLQPFKKGSAVQLPLDLLDSFSVANADFSDRSTRAAQSGMATDGAIAGVRVGPERALVAADSSWTSGPIERRVGGLEEAGTSRAKWDQFRTAEVMGVSTKGFQEEFYTTKRVRDLTPQQRESIERTAAAIEADRRSRAPHSGNRSEEARFSGARRPAQAPASSTPGAYVPPHQRASGGTSGQLKPPSAAPTAESPSSRPPAKEPRLSPPASAASDPPPADAPAAPTPGAPSSQAQAAQAQDPKQQQQQQQPQPQPQPPRRRGIEESTLPEVRKQLSAVGWGKGAGHRGGEGHSSVSRRKPSDIPHNRSALPADKAQALQELMSFSAKIEPKIRGAASAEAAKTAASAGTAAPAANGAAKASLPTSATPLPAGGAPPHTAPPATAAAASAAPAIRAAAANLSPPCQTQHRGFETERDLRTAAHAASGVVARAVRSAELALIRAAAAMARDSAEAAISAEAAPGLSAAEQHGERRVCPRCCLPPRPGL